MLGEPISQYIDGELPPHLLLIDDDDVVLTLIGGKLAHLGYQISTASSGKLGIEMLCSEHPDVIIADVSMPDVDGLEILRVVNSQSTETPVILFSSAAHLDVVLDALHKGAFGYVIKDESIDLLHLALQRALRHVKVIRENQLLVSQLKGENVRIAAKLREHEDDLQQFFEILQLAPQIFKSFVKETKTALRVIDTLLADYVNEAVLVDARRVIHTLKGNARGIGLHLVAGRAHAIESLITDISYSNRRATGSQLRDLAMHVDDLHHAVDRAQSIRMAAAMLSGSAGVDPVEDFSPESVTQLRLNVEQLQSLISSDHPAKDSLMQLEQQVQKLAEHALQGLFNYLKSLVRMFSESNLQAQPRFHVEGGDIRIPDAVFRSLAAALPHLVRNTLTHGIETPSEREAAGKPVSGQLHLRAKRRDDQLLLQLDDDGRGIDLNKVEHLFNNPNPLTDDPFTLTKILATPGLTTAPNITLDAGRGMGVGAALSAVQRVGGTLKIRPGSPCGTVIDIVLPL